MCVCMYVYMYICICIYIDTCSYMYTYIYMHIFYNIYRLNALLVPPRSPTRLSFAQGASLRLCSRSRAPEGTVRPERCAT